MASSASSDSEDGPVSFQPLCISPPACTHLLSLTLHLTNENTNTTSSQIQIQFGDKYKHILQPNTRAGLPVDPHSQCLHLNLLRKQIQMQSTGWSKATELRKSITVNPISGSGGVSIEKVARMQVGLLLLSGQELPGCKWMVSGLAERRIRKGTKAHLVSVSYY